MRVRRAVVAIAPNEPPTDSATWWWWIPLLAAILCCLLIAVLAVLFARRRRVEDELTVDTIDVGDTNNMCLADQNRVGAKNPYDRVDILPPRENIYASASTFAVPTLNCEFNITFHLHSHFMADDTVADPVDEASVVYAGFDESTLSAPAVTYSQLPDANSRNPPPNFAAPVKYEALPRTQPNFI